ncbi:MAG TPA: SGNH/GDSL hydrolase family protein [Mycobacteriales bacterium]|nr:SGNH/GDSL hydrolase family protein [Mycobacteriales bacterium]
MSVAGVWTRVGAAAIAAAVSVVGFAGVPAHAAKPGGGGGGGGGTSAYPNSMDALGDSITRAFNTCSFPFTDCTQNSWATGTNKTVNSYYLRLLKLNPAINGNNFNDAVSGAKMSDLNGQAQNAVSRKVGVVTILMGSNDACTSSISTMTPTSTFQSQFQQALTTLTTGLPNVQIRVGSIPDAYQLWTLFHANSSAVNTWNAYGICQSLLANATSTAQADIDRRATFRQQEIDYNTALQTVCAQFAQCTFDNDAGFNTQFSSGDVSTRDYFHPSISGQTLLANVAWSALGY